MNNSKTYSGTILENTYSPIVFSPITELPVLPAQADAVLKSATTARAINSALITAAAVTLPLSLPVGLVSGLATGLAVAFIPKKGKEVEGSFKAAEILGETADVLSKFDLLEAIFKKKELQRMSEKYHAFVVQVEKDFVSYKVEHEAYLQKSMDAVDGINRRKVVMKDYLLLELSEQLKRSGLNGRFDDPKIERLDPRAWSINGDYHLNVTSNKEFNDASVAYLPLFVEGVILISPIRNRIRIREIRNALDRLQPVADLNLEHMLSDLLKLDLFSAALVNIDTIYKEVLDKLRPIMKKILRDVEDKYQGDVRRMPKEQADALYTIKSLFKDLAETTIIPRSDDNRDIYTDVCQYSNTLSERYNTIRETIYNNFCS